MTIYNPQVSKCFDTMNKTIKGRLESHCQHTGVRWMFTRELAPDVKGGILADDMGLGKTMQTIGVICGNPLPKTLIVTTVGTIGQWRDALITFGGLFPIIVTSSYMGLIPDDAKVVVTAYSTFQKPKIGHIGSIKWSRIVLDEGHTIRNNKTRVYKQLSQLSSDIKWILTGTPIQNSIKELRTLFSWIGIQHEINENSKNMYTLRRTQQEEAKQNPRLALPGVQTTIVKLQLNPTERELYNRVLSNGTEDHLETLMRCRQVCSSAHVYHEGIERKRQKVSDDVMCDTPKKREFYKSTNTSDDTVSTKIDYLCNDLQKVKTGIKSLVFCALTTEMKLIQKHLLKLNVNCLIYDGSLSRDQKDNVLYNFKHSNIPVLILQINCGNTGLNLQHAQRVYIVSPHWNPCVELQAIGRAYRKGQLSIVHVIRLVMSDTIEEKCLDIQNRKLELIADQLDDDSFIDRLGKCELDTSELRELVLSDTTFRPE